MSWINYGHIKARINKSQILSYYGIELQSVGDKKLKGSCPLPKHAGDRSNKNAFSVDTEKNPFNSFTNRGGGGIGISQPHTVTA